MERRDPRTRSERLRIVLDSGAVIAECRGDPRARAFSRTALRSDALLIVPPIVVTETYRGSARDVAINRLLAAVFVPDVGEELARVAGRLLAASHMSAAADAQVVAEALRRAPCTILTGDPGDIRRLAEGMPGITVVSLDQL